MATLNVPIAVKFLMGEWGGGRVLLQQHGLIHNITQHGEQCTNVEQRFKEH